jgi:NAD(P)-dependent dehydrogenase (short-subunit alcohol dehydrogenase family)
MTAHSEKIALVTGANRGLGLEIARQLARQNVQVVLTARRAALGRAAADLLGAEGLQVVFHLLDVQDSNSIRRLAGFLDARYGRLDLLINNAGAHVKHDGAGREASAARMLEAFAINCVAAVEVSQGLLGLLRKNGSSRIINISTLLGQPAHMDQFPGQLFAYRVAKSALNAATAALAVELATQGVAVNAVHPGWLKTAMGGPGAPQSVEEGAEAVVHLALDVPGSVTGRFFLQRAVAPW